MCTRQTLLWLVSLAVAAKKLVRVQKVAEECKKKTISVIAIAKRCHRLNYSKKGIANPIFRQIQIQQRFMKFGLILRCIGKALSAH